MATQAMFGSSGDNCPWHGTPLNSSYDISTAEWWDFDEEMGDYICDVYYNSKPTTAPNLLLLFNYGRNISHETWVTENCPGAYRKKGMASHVYQIK